jgi:hypothetical protein
MRRMVWNARQTVYGGLKQFEPTATRISIDNDDDMMITTTTTG